MKIKKFNVFLLTLFFFIESIYGDVTVSGNPAPLIVSTATAGSNTNQVSNTSTTYSLTAVALLSRIVGSINTAVPTNTTLSIQLAAPPGATSTGAVALTTTSQNLVTGILLALGGGPFQITYTFACPVSAGVVSTTTRQVTLTILVL